MICPVFLRKVLPGKMVVIRQNATGIGLYLCKRLCDKLGIGIAAQSGETGTTMILSFQINHFIHQVQG